MSRYNPKSIPDADIFTKLYPQYVTLNETDPYWTIPTDAGKKRQFFDAVEDWGGVGIADTTKERDALIAAENNFQLMEAVVFFNKRAKLEVEQEMVTWLLAGTVLQEIPVPSEVAVPFSLFLSYQHNYQVGLAQIECAKQGIEFSNDKISPTAKRVI